MLTQNAALINQLGGQFQGMNTVLNAQAITQLIPTFSGKKTEFREWLKNIEKYATLVNADDKKIAIAYQSSAGVVSDFIRRFLKTPDRNNWDVLIKQLSERFSAVADEHHAYSLLQKIKQTRGESVPQFTERLINLANDAFKDKVAEEIVQKQLVGIFVSGLAFDHLKLKVMRDNPATLDAASKVAMTEQNIRLRFEQTQKHVLDDDRSIEPMEINHARPRTCFKCGKGGHIARNCFKVSEVQQAQTQQRQQARCFYCDRTGHFRRDCRDWQRQRGRTHWQRQGRTQQGN